MKSGAIQYPAKIFGSETIQVGFDYVRVAFENQFCPTCAIIGKYALVDLTVVSSSDPRFRKVESRLSRFNLAGEVPPPCWTG